MNRNSTNPTLKVLGLGMALLMIATPAMAGTTWVQADQDHLMAPHIETDLFTRHPDADLVRVAALNWTVNPDFKVCFLDRHGFELSCWTTGGGATYIPQGTKAFTVSLVSGLNVDYYLLQASID